MSGATVDPEGTGFFRATQCNTPLRFNLHPPTSIPRLSEVSLGAPRISIITVCRNAESVIGHTINSVLQQSIPEIEFIIVDGASTDDTNGVIERVGQGIPNVISEPDDGIYHAMNKGILRARGEFLLFLNAGDTLLYTKTIETALNTINKAQHADVYHAGVLWFDPTTGRSQLKPAIRATGANLYRGSLNHQGVFIRRELFDRIGAYDQSYQFAGDYEWFLRATRQYSCRFERIDAYISVFLLGGNTTGGKHDELIDAECRRAKGMYYTKWDAVRYRPWIRVRKILGI